MATAGRPGGETAVRQRDRCKFLLGMREHVCGSCWSTPFRTVRLGRFAADAKAVGVSIAFRVRANNDVGQTQTLKSTVWKFLEGNVYGYSMSLISNSTVRVLTVSQVACTVIIVHVHDIYAPHSIQCTFEY